MAGIDLLADLALVGLVETGVAPLALVDGEHLDIGSPLLLIGYPGDSTRQPRPALTQALVSRLREQESFGITYLQVDTPMAGGQSGGIAVTMEGDVIGLTGYRVTDVRLGLIASAADIAPRLDAMLAAPVGEFRGGEPARGDTQHTFEMSNNWIHQAFIVHAPVGTLITAEVDGQGDAVLIIQDTLNIDSFVADETAEGTEAAQLTTTTAGPHFVIVRQRNPLPITYTLQSNQTLIPYVDPDDGRTLDTGDVYQGMSDYPVDIDVYTLLLTKDEEANINLSSLLIDPFLIVESVALGIDSLVRDDDSGEGVLGWDAELTYRAANTGSFRVLATDVLGRRSGGYQIRVREPYAAAPTPMGPPATTTPAPSPIGRVARYESRFYPFAISYPAGYDAEPEIELCRVYARCFAAPSGQVIIGIDEFELTEFNGRPVTLEDIRQELETRSLNAGLQLVSHEEITSDANTPAVVSIFEEPDRGLRYKVFNYILEPNFLFRVVYHYLESDYNEEMTDYLISTFEVTR